MSTVSTEAWTEQEDRDLLEGYLAGDNYWQGPRALKNVLKHSERAVEDRLKILANQVALEWLPDFERAREGKPFTYRDQWLVYQAVQSESVELGNFSLSRISRLLQRSPREVRDWLKTGCQIGNVQEQGVFKDFRAKKAGQCGDAGILAEFLRNRFGHMAPKIWAW